MLARELSKKEQLNEIVLLKNLAYGDYDAFNTLYNTHVRQLTDYAAKFTVDTQVIEDCIHDIFVWLWQARRDLEITHSLKGYLFKCVRTSILKKVQKHKRIVLLNDAGEENDFTFFVSAEEEYISLESTAILKEKMVDVLGLLTSKQKEVIYLRFYQGLSFDEIAINMNLTTKACYKLMGRAISELRKNCLHAWQV